MAAASVIIPESGPPDLRGRHREVQASAHPHCVVCGTGGVPFAVLDDGQVEGRFARGEWFQGYTGVVHGGVVATLLDAAMTQCLFALERQAMTAELRVRYHLPVLSQHDCVVRARLERRRRDYFELRAELLQEGQLKASASGKFLDPSSRSGRRR